MAMAGLEPVAGVAQRHPHLDQLAGHERLRIRVGPAMGEVQDPGAHPRRRPVRRHVGQADDGGRDGRVDREVQDRDRLAQDRERLDEGRARERRARCASSGRRSRASPFGIPPAPQDRLPRVPTVGSVPIGVDRRRATGPRSTSRPASGSRPALERGTAGRRSPDAGRRRPPASAPATPPGTPPARRSRARTRRPRGSSSSPFGSSRSQRSKNRTTSWSSSRFGPGRRVLRPAVDPVADQRPRRRACSAPASGTPRRRRRRTSRRC